MEVAEQSIQKRAVLYDKEGDAHFDTPDGFQEISRAKLIEPTTDQLPRRDGVTWTHPAFAYRHVFVRNDKALVCADLSAQPDEP